MSASKKKKKVNKKVNNNKNLKVQQEQEKLSRKDILEEKQEIKNDETAKVEKTVEENVEEEKIKQEEIKEEKESLPEENIVNNSIIEKEETQLVKVEPKEEKKEENNKRKIIIIVCVLLTIIIVALMSTVFALFNANNSKIVTGVKLKNIDLSRLSIEESKSKLENNLNAELLDEVKLKYNDYEVSLEPKQIEFKYNIDEALNQAYKIGRRGNILKDNYEIIFTALLGRNENISYTYNEDFLNEFVDDVSSKIPGVVVNPSYYIEGENLIISKGTDGISVKKDELKNKILNAIIERNFEKINSKDYNLPLEIPVEETKAENINIENIYSEVRRDPQDAYFVREPYQIFADEDGIDFDIENAKNILKEEKEEYSIPLIITKAQKTISDLGFEAFPDVLSSFSTNYIASNVNRSTNLAIAASKINGKVLMPGEVFSFNKVVGKRTVEEGYKDAQIYADGGVVDGLAGGICQISSTLYDAVLLANLEIVERRNHSFVTSYLPAGKDATVVYGAIDFQFKNSRNYPIKIEASVKGGKAEFIIHGIKEEQEYEIKIIPVTTGSIPYTTQYVQDATLPPGAQVVSQAGHAGYKVTTYIEKRLNGEVVSKDVLSNDTYSPMKTIIRVGPGVPVQ